MVWLMESMDYWFEQAFFSVKVMRLAKMAIEIMLAGLVNTINWHYLKTWN